MDSGPTQYLPIRCFSHSTRLGAYPWNPTLSEQSATNPSEFEAYRIIVQFIQQKELLPKIQKLRTSSPLKNHASYVANNEFVNLAIFQYCISN
jgi:hypothetical protein